MHSAFILIKHWMAAFGLTNSLINVDVTGHGSCIKDWFELVQPWACYNSSFVFISFWSIASLLNFLRQLRWTIVSQWTLSVVVLCLVVTVYWLPFSFRTVRLLRRWLNCFHSSSSFICQYFWVVCGHWPWIISAARYSMNLWNWRLWNFHSIPMNFAGQFFIFCITAFRIQRTSVNMLPYGWSISLCI